LPNESFVYIYTHVLVGGPPGKGEGEVHCPIEHELGPRFPWPLSTGGPYGKKQPQADQDVGAGRLGA
jgi:hypothetical protein